MPGPLQHYGLASSQCPKETWWGGDKWKDILGGQLHSTYSVSASYSSATQSLVDHGANGGIGGSDVWIIYKTPHHSVDVQGINNHQMIDIPIATVGGVINTQCREVIAIMHQYAYTGLDTSIHSSAQLNWYKNDVNDHSIKVGDSKESLHWKDMLFHSTLCKVYQGWLYAPILTRNGKTSLMLSSPVSWHGILANKTLI